MPVPDKMLRKDPSLEEMRKEQAEGIKRIRKLSNEELLNALMDWQFRSAEACEAIGSYTGFVWGACTCIELAIFAYISVSSSVVKGIVGFALMFGTFWLGHHLVNKHKYSNLPEVYSSWTRWHFRRVYSAYPEQVEFVLEERLGLMYKLAVVCRAGTYYFDRKDLSKAGLF